MTERRFSERRSLYKQLMDGSPVRGSVSDFQSESILRSLDRALHELLSSQDRKAFDLTLRRKAN